MTIFWYIFESYSQRELYYDVLWRVVNDYILVHFWKLFTTGFLAVPPSSELLMTIFWYIFESYSQHACCPNYCLQVVNDYILAHFWKLFTTSSTAVGFPFKLQMNIFHLKFFKINLNSFAVLYILFGITNIGHCFWWGHNI